MASLKQLAGQTALYGLSSMLGRALNFLLVPFYTGLLSAYDFGIQTDLYAYIAFFNVIYLFGMETAYFRFSNKEGANQEEVFQHSLTQLALSSFFLSLLIILFAAPLASWLRYPDKADLVIYTALILFTDAICAIPFARLRHENKALRFASIRLINIFLNIGFNLLFFLVYPKQIKIEYIFLANLLANAVMVLLFTDVFLNVKWKINKPLLSQMMPYAWPIMFMGLAGMVNEVLDRIILKYLLPKNYYPGLNTLAALGVYGACYKLSMFMSLAIQAFRYAGEPFFFSKAQDKNAPALFARVMKWFIIFCLFLFVVVGCNLNLFGLILRSEVYRQGLMVVPILLLANLFLGIYYTLSPWYKLTDRTQIGMWVGIAGAGITIIANIALVPFLGYMGSAWATLICYASMALISYVLGHKYYPVPYQLGNAILHIVFAVALVYSAIYLSSGPGLSLTQKYGIPLLFTLAYPVWIFITEKGLKALKA